MALVNTINFLPQVFQTSTNQRFLGATLDHLATDSVNQPVNGYIGKTFTPTYKLTDNYVPDFTKQRQHYQLEPGVVVTNGNKNIEFTAGYIDLLDSIDYYGGKTQNHNRLFASETYNYDGHFDYDKFVNYYNYYWLPNGPDAVALTTNVPYSADYTVTRNTAVGGYNFTGRGLLPNAPLALARGGTYTFQLNQPGFKFWIQTDPGTEGMDPNISTVSTRDVYGVTNNGVDVGTITFQVPTNTAQDFYVAMPIASTVNAAVDFNYADIQNRLLSDFLTEFPGGLDGINTQLQSKTIVFVNNNQATATWTTPAVPSAYTSLDRASIRPGEVIGTADRTSVWTVNLVSTNTGDYIMQLAPSLQVIKQEKVFVGSGRTYASKEFWVNNKLQFALVPRITAVSDYLYYQDAANPDFVGKIKLVDNATSTIDVTNDIIGQAEYTSPNGLVFTNGLKVKFDHLVTPIDYYGTEYTEANKWNDAVVALGASVTANNLAYAGTTLVGDWNPITSVGYIYRNEYYVEGVGTSITLIPVDALIVPEIGNITATDINSTGGLDVRTADIDIDPDYITINRGSADRNPWTRYNRWFHKDVINATAVYNNKTADFGPNTPARRPIIEFEANLQLFEYGRRAKDPITLIWGIDSTDFVTDAFNDYEGFAKQAGHFIVGREYVIEDPGTSNTLDLSYTDWLAIGATSRLRGTVFTATGVGSGTGTAWMRLNGRQLQHDDRVVFANDYDISIRNKIYQVNIEKFTGGNFLRLVETVDDPILHGENILVLAGTKYSVNSPNTVGAYTYNITSDGTIVWALCQAKQHINQSPKFDLVDGNGYQFSNETVYPGNDFQGTAFFGYATGTGNNDAVLTNLKLKYQNFNNIGDIVFANYYDTDTFKYIVNQKTVTKNCNTGYLIKNQDFETAVKLNSWVKNLEETAQYQIFTKFFDGYVIPVDGVQKAYVQVDVLPVTETLIPHTKVYINNTLAKSGTDYNLVAVGVYYAIVLETMPAVGDKIDVLVYSNTASNLGYYEVPKNLDLNPLNENFSSITLGQLRTHYNKLIENTTNSPIGAIPLQDNYLKARGGTLVQHTSPAIYAMTFLTDPLVNFVNGLQLAKKEYIAFKNKFLSLCSTQTGLDYNNPAAGVDAILQNINIVKNGNFPWYYSDMVPQGSQFDTITYTVLNARQTKYEISSIFDNTQLSNRAVLVYVNGVQQTVGVDFTFSLVSPSITFTNQFTADDVANGTTITIRDYSDTDGNYIPETPSKLGLYPKFTPRIYRDNTFQTPIDVIQGHDGSITPVFGDFRDNYLLELEKRIYNNIKADYSKNEINLYSIIPGRFRDTGYTSAEYNEILSQGFYAWSGSNNIDYTSNTQFDVNNSWTWNYSKFKDVVDQSNLQGSWRAIYNYWFDTDTPNLTPWKMLGFSSEPTWWATRYSTGPYTSGNKLLWEDLEAGYIWAGSASSAYIDPRFVRPGLTSFIPVNSSGDLLSPDAIPLVSQYDQTTAGNNFAAGEIGPAESAWRRSSDYPFSLQMVIALCKPAKYFSTAVDISRFTRNTSTNQYLTSGNQKITPGVLAVNGDATSGTVQRTSGYINWIGDSIKNVGIDPVAKLTEYFSNLNIQLNYKVGGFTDKNLITVFAEQTSPGSTNASVVVPDSNYNIYLTKSVPVGSAVYSAVIVEKTNTGYAVSGYDPTHPFFTILPSVANNNNQEITLNGTTVKLYQTTTGVEQVIPYGTEFSSVQQVADFLISYERHLVAQGFTFNQFDQDLNQTRNWTLSVQELIYWHQQGWTAGTIIVLNPTATQIALSTVSSIVDEISNSLTGSKVLDQNFIPIKSNGFDILRTENAVDGNKFLLRTLNGSTVCYARLHLVQHEHTMIFDNVSEFGDILYVPSQGTRQSRLKLAGAKTGAWTGALSAPGYIYNDPTFVSWQSGTDYKTGDIVVYNNFYYTASQNITASATFDPTKWTQVNLDAIKTGLLPSFGQQAQTFDRIYDIDKPLDNEQFQAYSAGLIGFRQRQFLTDLGISIPTQTKFYQGYIKEKGSVNSINALTKANFNNVNGNVSIYEEWAFKVGSYGGIDTNTYKEFILDQGVFTTNPVAFTLTDTYSNALPIVNLTLSNVYNASNISSTSTSLYSNRTSDAYMSDLPTAGYVNLNDVDYTIFDINTFNTSIDVGAGNKIWVAKDSTAQWNIFRVTETNLYATDLIYTLDSYAQIKFNNAHSFKKNDSLVLKGFDSRFDGIYEVVDIANATAITVTITHNIKDLIRAGVIGSTGQVYALKSAKTDYVTDIPNITPPNGWLENDRVWVNNATASYGWGVYTFNKPWVSTNSANVSANVATAGDYFGSAVRVSSTGQYYYVGNPGRKQVQVFSNTATAGVTLSNTFANFGSVIESQGNIVAIGSQNLVHVFNHNNGVLTPVANISFPGVTSISMTSGGNIFVGGNNTVSLYKTTNYSTYTLSSTTSNTGAFGTSIKVTPDGSKLFVGAPIGAGYVNYYTVSNGVISSTPKLIVSSYTSGVNNFGTSLDTDSTGQNLFIGSPGSTFSGLQNGLVERYVLTGSTYTHQANITHPHNETGAFGKTISVSADARVLAVYGQGSAAEETTTFDSGTFMLDAGSTWFIDSIANSGSVYMFEPLVKQSDSADLGIYAFVQELETGPHIEVHAGDQFGAVIDATRNVVLVGSPGYNANSGEAYAFNNSIQDIAWNLTRQQQPNVDVESISRTFIYNKSNNNMLAALDYVDPIKGKVLNVAGQDIDYQRVSDPAMYNQGTGSVYTDLHWGPAQVGHIWWNLDTVRFVDYEQDDLNYRLTNWGKQFPGSSIDVYEWVESPVLPSEFVAKVGAGTPLHQDDSAYSTYGYVDQSGNVKLKYYFWVSNRDQVSASANKNNSVISITSMIENPQAQGIPYVSILRDDTVSLHNVNNLLVGQSSVLQLGQQTPNTSLVHSEYALVQEGNPSSQIPTAILSKLIDSLSGLIVNDYYTSTDFVKVTYPVPDPTLPMSQRYGINADPLQRQTMIMDRSLALTNYFDIVNAKLITYPVVSRKVLTTLNSEQAAPSLASGKYDFPVDTYDKLAYVNASSMTAGTTKILVKTDSTNSGKWAIYQFAGVNSAGENTYNLVELQSYKTNLYWKYADWYDSSFDPTTTINISVQTALDLGKLVLTPNTYIKVMDTGAGKFAIYYVDNLSTLNLVGIESGTVQILSGTPGSIISAGLFISGVEYIITDLGNTTQLQWNDIAGTTGVTYQVGDLITATNAGTGTGTAKSIIDIPGRELRQILTSMQNEVFIDDLAMDYNDVFFTMVKYILTEQKNIDWVFKTSFISALQNIRKLEHFPSYIPDNQSFYLDYINEVKPYRTVVREFIIDYQKNDTFGGDITDFDLPSYWDSALGVYRSPNGEQPYDAALLNSTLYENWKNNYTYKIVDFRIENPGKGYVTPPDVIITGGGGTGANAIAHIFSSNGALSSIEVISSGSNYTSTPTITINGASTTGAKVRAVLRNVWTKSNVSLDGFHGHNVIRSVKTTVKFDRVTYTGHNANISANTGLASNNIFQQWSDVYEGQVIAANTIINLDNTLYKLANAAANVYTNYTATNLVFPPLANLTVVNPAEFTNANDRIVAFNGNIDFSLLDDGDVYPGVTIDSNTYTKFTPNLIVAVDSLISHNGTVYLTTGNVYSSGSSANVAFAPLLANINTSRAIIEYADVNSTRYIGNKADSIISSAYTDTSLGIRSTDINIDGGAYVDTYSSHAPEEMIPGRMFDTLDMRVFESDYAFRNFYSNLSQGNVTSHRISNAATTTLTSDFFITDEFMYVADATVLPSPDLTYVHPGVVFVNGEKITYWRNFSHETVKPWIASNAYIGNSELTSFNGNIYLTTGNVFAPNIAWIPNTAYAINSNVYYNGNSYITNGNVAAPHFSDIIGNVTFLYSGNNSGFNSIKANVKLIGTNTNILGQLRRGVDGTAPNNLTIHPWTTNTARPVGTYISYQGNTYISTGNVYAWNTQWQSNLVVNTGSYIYHVGNVYQTTGNVYSQSFSDIQSNVTYIRAGTDSGFVSISSNLSYVFAGTSGLRHLANTRVVDASIDQHITGTDTYFANIGTSPVTLTVTANVSWKLRANANIVANIGDYITSGSANARVLSGVTTCDLANIAVINVTGNIATTTGSTISVNGVDTGANIFYATVLGTVQANGNVVLSSTTNFEQQQYIVTQSNVWTSNITATITTSNTIQAMFLKAQPGYTP